MRSHLLTLHADLCRARQDVDYFVSIDGKLHPLHPHDESSRADLRREGRMAAGPRPGPGGPGAPGSGGAGGNGGPAIGIALAAATEKDLDLRTTRIVPGHPLLDRCQPSRNSFNISRLACATR